MKFLIVRIISQQDFHLAEVAAEVGTAAEGALVRQRIGVGVLLPIAEWIRDADVGGKGLVVAVSIAPHGALWEALVTVR